MTNHQKPQPLAGLKVVDFTSMLAGPYCTRLLADSGAEVIKIEPAAGDAVRNFPPIVDGVSAYFAQLNCGKKSIVLDLTSDDGKAQVHNLIGGADIVVENFRPGVMTKLGLDYSTLAEDNPDLVFCSISGFGQSGPRATEPAYAPIVHAASGFDEAQTSIEGDGRGPAITGIFTADILAAVYAFGAIQTALLGRERHGGGQFIDVALMDSMINLLVYDTQAAQNPVATPRTTYAPTAAADGFVIITPVSAKNFEQMSDVMGHSEWKTDERFQGMRDRRENWPALLDLMAEWASTRPAAEIEKMMMTKGVPCSRYQTVSEALADPQVIARGLMVPASNTGGAFSVSNPPYRFADGGVSVTPTAPELGEHTEEVVG